MKPDGRGRFRFCCRSGVLVLVITIGFCTSASGKLIFYYICVMDNVKIIKFYRDSDGEWYADVEGHSKSENRMIAGSDKFLQALLDWNDRTDGYGWDSVQMAITTDKPEKEDYLFELRRVIHDKFGATYLIKKNKDSRIYCEDKMPKLCWLCNVVHTVLGEHPKRIYILNEI